MGKADDTSALNTTTTTTMDKPKLQAVILADSFLTTFQPISLDVPKVLCPLNNVPLLHYAMDFLASNGVEQVFVICTNDQVEAELLVLLQTNNHNNNNHNNNNHNNTATWQGRMVLECIKDTSLTNAGDALRELYKRNVIQSDPFLLLFGDVVTNMDLSQAMVAHQERHVHDSSAIMTVVLKETGTSAAVSQQQKQQQHQSRIQCAKSDLIVGYDPTHQNRVLLYDNCAAHSTVALPCSFFGTHPEITIRTDVLDTGVYICSPDVLGRFEDEFDYLDIAQDFVHNCVAEEEEGLQTRIHAHWVRPLEYAARIVDWATYHAISKDLLRRWGYPLVADNTIQHSSHPTTAVTHPPQQQRYKSSTAAAASVSPTLSPYYLYKESVQPSKVERSSIIQGPGLLGSRGQIQDFVTIRTSVLGHDVTIGNGAMIDDSHIWDHVIIEPNAKVLQSILAKHVIIKQGAVISRGCIIGQGCVIGENIVLPEYTRITLQHNDEEGDDLFGDMDDDDNDASADDDGAWVDEKNKVSSNSNTNKKGGNELELQLQTDMAVVGKDGKGRVWQPSLEEEEDSDDEDKDDGGHDANDNHTNLQSVGADLTGYYQKRLQRQAEPEDDGFSEGQEDDVDDLMESEAFARYTEGAFTFADTPASNSSGSSAVRSGDLLVVGRQKGVDVVKELKEICMEFEDSGNTPMENLAIELNSYKFSQNASYSDCTMAAMLAMLDKLQITPDMTDGKLVSAFKHKLEFWAPLFQKMSIGHPEEIAIIEGLERAATSTTGDGSLTGVAQKLSKGLGFRFLLQTLHAEEVLSDGSLLAWAEKRKSEGQGDTPVGKLFRLQSVQEFLEWLEEDDDDDDDSSGDDDESQ